MTTNRPLAETHRSKSGKAVISLRERGSGADPANNVYPALPTRYQVSAMDGHEILPRTRNFHNEADARRYANELWRSL